MDTGQEAVRRVCWRILPLLFAAYFVAYIDRVNVGFAALTMDQDLGLAAELLVEDADGARTADIVRHQHVYVHPDVLARGARGRTGLDGVLEEVVADRVRRGRRPRRSTADRTDHHHGGGGKAGEHPQLHRRPLWWDPASAGGPFGDATANDVRVVVVMGGRLGTRGH